MVNGAVVCLPVPAEGDVVQDSRDVWSPLALPTKPDAQYVSPKAELVLEVGGGKTPLYSFDEVLTTIRYQGRPGNLLRNDELASHVYYAPGSQKGAKSALVDLIGVSHILCAGNLLGGQESWPGFWQPADEGAPAAVGPGPAAAGAGASRTSREPQSALDQEASKLRSALNNIGTLLDEGESYGALRASLGKTGLSPAQVAALMACVDMGSTAADKERKGVPLTIKEGEVLWKSMVKCVQANHPEQARELLIEAAKRDPTVLMAAACFCPSALSFASCALPLQAQIFCHNTA